MGHQIVPYSWKMAKKIKKRHSLNLRVASHFHRKYPTEAEVMRDVSFPTQITHKTTTSKLEVVHFHSFHSLPSILRQHEHTQVKNTRRQHGNIKCLTADPNEMNLKASDNKRGQMQEHISSHFGLDCVCASKPLWRAEDC